MDTRRRLNVNKKSVVVFDHIPKCGGMSVSMALVNSGRTSYGVASASGLIEACNKINNKEHTGVTFLYGHFAYGAHELISKDYDVHYFTLLRNPVSFARSFYEYKRVRCRYTYGSFHDFILDNQFDGMVNLLGGSLRAAVERLETYFFVGFVELFPASILHLSKAIGVDLSPDFFANKKSKTPEGRDAPFSELPSWSHSPDFLLYSHFWEKKTMASKTDMVCDNVAYAKGDNKAQSWTCFCHAPSSNSLAIEKGSPEDQVFIVSKRLRLNVSDTTFCDILDKYKDYCVDILDSAQVNSEFRYEKAYRVLNVLLANATHAGNSHVVLQAQAMLCFLAMSPHGAALGVSERLFLQAIDLNPESAGPRYTYAIWLRMHSRTMDALNVLSSIPQEKRSFGSYYAEYITTLYADKGRACVLEFLKGQHAHSEQYAASVKAMAAQTSPEKHLLSCLAGKKTLAVRSGPEVVFEDLLIESKKIPFEAHVLLQEAYRKGARYCDHTRLFMNDGCFVPDENFIDKDTILSAAYDNVVLVCSNFESLNSLTNFIAFFCGNSIGDVFAYPMNNMHLPDDKKYLVRLA